LTVYLVYGKEFACFMTRQLAAAYIHLPLKVPFDTFSLIMVKISFLIQTPDAVK
jgi:hypothetical protein